MMVIERSRLNEDRDFELRWRCFVVLMSLAMVMLVSRAVYLQVYDKQHLITEGKGVFEEVAVPAHRGRILDRNANVLAISTAVKSIWINPKEFVAAEDNVKALSEAMRMAPEVVRERVSDSHRGFVYMRRKMPPGEAERVLSLKMPGIHADREYRRFYPAGTVTAHLIGFNNIEDQGQEGMELAYNGWLKGIPGSKRVMRDRGGRVIEDVEDLRAPVPGKDMVLSIDQQLQYMAYRELKKAVLEHKAKSGSLVLLDAKNGEVLAMVNEPTFNPNKRSKLKGSVTRNRVMTDVFEPGSTVKPFLVACAMELGMVEPETSIDTAPGLMRVGHNIVRDTHNYGRLDVTHILQKSSNVGVSKIALSLPSQKLWAFYNNLGFGQPLDTGFPGEVSGRLSHHENWDAFEQATLSFGYGVSTSLLQLGRAYLPLANEGIMPMVSVLKQDSAVQTHRIMSAKTANSVRAMLEQVVTKEGTALRAGIPGYRVAGKTGTVKKLNPKGGYSESGYLSLFAGMAPASDPKLVMVVMIDEPGGGEYYGGVVAAPVFSSVMEQALRRMNVPPDQPETLPDRSDTEEGAI